MKRITVHRITPEASEWPWDSADGENWEDSCSSRGQKNVRRYLQILYSRGQNVCSRFDLKRGVSVACMYIWRMCARLLYVMMSGCPISCTVYVKVGLVCPCSVRIDNIKFG
jgi:hypothetical protein